MDRKSIFAYGTSVRRAFTLVELIVVVGIIGILAGIIITSFSGGMESARAAQCLSNMRNLAQGATATPCRKARTSSPTTVAFAHLGHIW